MAWVLLAAMACRPAAPALGPTLRERFGEHDFLTPRDAPPTVAVVAGGTIDTRAATCGACHADHQHEWGATTHAAAMRDLQFFGELAKPDQPVWLCLNCHAPTVPQRAEALTLDTHLASADSIAAVIASPNPDYDPLRVAEGVTCATCHVRRDVDGQGVVIGPRGSGRAPHRVRVDPDALRGICVSCHSPGDVVLTPTFPCWFKTAEELASGPDKDRSCVECHMPEATRPAAAGGPDLALRRHVWVGGGVPKTVDGYATLAERGWTSGLEVAVRPGEGGAAGTVAVALTNTAGHSLPTGDPERFLRVEVRFERSSAAVSRDVLRVGQTWDWGDGATGRPAHRTEDARIGPGATLTWPAKPDPAGADTLVVEVLSVRLTVDNARALAATKLPASLLTLWPEAEAELPELATRYPMATWVYRGTYSLPGGSWPPTAGGDLALEAEPQAALIARSVAFAALPLDLKAPALSIP